VCVCVCGCALGRLRQWYLRMFEAGRREGFVHGVDNLSNAYFPRPPVPGRYCALTELPYNEGDYWPGVAEEFIGSLGAGGGGGGGGVGIGAGVGAGGGAVPSVAPGEPAVLAVGLRPGPVACANGDDMDVGRGEEGEDGDDPVVAAGAAHAPASGSASAPGSHRASRGRRGRGGGRRAPATSAAVGHAGTSSAPPRAPVGPRVTLHGQVLEADCVRDHVDELLASHNVHLDLLVVRLCRFCALCKRYFTSQGADDRVRGVAWCAVTCCMLSPMVLALVVLSRVLCCHPPPHLICSPTPFLCVVVVHARPPQVRYTCLECPPSFELCLRCYSSEGPKHPHPLVEAPVALLPVNTDDCDPPIESPFFDTRLSLLSLCQVCVKGGGRVGAGDCHGSLSPFPRCGH
jgi:hypothetical protein